MLTKQTCTLLMAIACILEYIRHDYKKSASYEKYVDEACKYSIYGHNPHFKVHMTRLQNFLHALSMDAVHMYSVYGYNMNFEVHMN